jgi:8-oxo-dGTP pyrophosphatase MutT (NUDIX family)
MAPRPRAGKRAVEIPEHARKAAALLLLYPLGADAHVALTLRASHLPNHAGQVSLPGGAVEAGETIEATALREASEEVGIEPSALHVLGQLTPLHIPVSGFVLHPVVAVADHQPSFIPSVHEVARVIDVPLSELCDPSAVRLRRNLHENRHYEVPYFRIAGETVWGATAMVLSEFLTLLGCPPQRPSEPTAQD